MPHLVFVYGTLLAGEVNHHLLSGADLLGDHRTEPCFTMLDLGAYPGVIRRGCAAIAGEIYGVGAKRLELLDRLEDFPRLFDRTLIRSPFGRAWIYLYRGPVNGRAAVQSGDWRVTEAGTDALRAAARRRIRDHKNPRWRELRCR